MKIDIDRDDERKLFEAYYSLDTMLNGKDKLSRSALYQENQQLKQQLSDIEESYNNTMKYLNKTRSKLLNLPKKIVKEIRDVAGKYWDFNICKECGNVPVLNTLTTKDFDEILDAILKKFGGKDDFE